MTVTQLIEELQKVPDPKAEVEYWNIEINCVRGIEQVRVKYNEKVIVGSKYLVVLK